MRDTIRLVQKSLNFQRLLVFIEGQHNMLIFKDGVINIKLPSFFWGGDSEISMVSSIDKQAIDIS